MTDYTAAVMLATDRATWDEGMIVDIFPYAMPAGEAISNSRLGYITVTDCPLTLRELKDLLLPPLEEMQDVGGETVPVQVARRQWKMNKSLVPRPVMNGLSRDRRVSFTWTQVRDYLQKYDGTLLKDV